MNIPKLALRKPLKAALLVIGALLLVAAAIGMFLLATFDANAQRERIQRLVEREYGRRLLLTGTLKLRLLPSVSLELGAAELKEKNSPALFAVLQAARVKLKLWPLLRNQLQVDSAQFTGLRLRLRRHADGSTNFDDLLPRGPATDWRLNLERASVTDARIQLVDEMTGSDIVLDRLRLDIDGLKAQQPANLKAAFRAAGAQPQFASDVQLQLRLRLGAKGLVAVDNLRLSFAGDAAELRALRGSLAGAIDWQGDHGALRAIVFEATGKLNNQPIKARVAAPNVTWSQAGLHLPTVEFSASTRVGQHQFDIALGASDLRRLRGTLSVAAVNARLRARYNDLTLAAHARAALTYDLGQRLARSENLALRLDADFGPRSAASDALTRLRLTRKGEIEFDAVKMELRSAARAAQLTLERGPNKIAGEFNDALSIAFARQAYSLRADLLHTRGHWLQQEIEIEAGAHAQGTLDLARGNVDIERLRVRGAGSGQSLAARLAAPLAITWNHDGTHLRGIDARIDATLASHPYQLSVAAPTLTRTGTLWRAPMAELNAAGRIDQRAVKLVLRGAIETDSARQRFAWRGRGRLNATNIQGQVAVENFSAPRYSLDLSADQLNLGRYLTTASKRASSARTPSAAVHWDEWLQALKALPVHGTLRIAQLRDGTTRMRDVRIELK